jgi:hypothetical protein
LLPMCALHILVTNLHVSNGKPAGCRCDEIKMQDHAAAMLRC